MAQHKQTYASVGLRKALWGLSLYLLGGGACGGVVDEGKLPPDVRDPETLHTPAGALARYRGALDSLPKTFDWFLTKTGILTDELASLPVSVGAGQEPYTSIDSRQDLTGFSDDYTRLQRLRGQAREARGFVQAYVPDSSPALAGHLFAVEGYAEIFLADLFCSGIPLSTVDFDGDYTLAAGSSTAEVYAHAVTLFDSALASADDSVRFRYLAAVGKGRALVALGRYAEAAAAVAMVPDNYQYQVLFVPAGQGGPIRNRLLATFADPSTGTTARGYRVLLATPSVGDHEGINGLDYRTSNDPRTLTIALSGTDPVGNTMYFPAKYPTTGNVTLTLADGVEARLIEAEAALQAGSGAWLTRLNALRTDGTYDTTATSPPDTLWHAGGGVVAGLAPLTDPGTADGRIDLLFRERAFWLWLTGHRQGDLRRLVREYLRPPAAVYPTGLYPGGTGVYGDEVVASLPEQEQQYNPKYLGCFHTGA